MGNIDWQERDRKELAQRVLLGELSVDIARELGEGWTVVKSKSNNPSENFHAPNYVELAGPNGAELGLSVSYPYDNTCHVAAHFTDRDKDGNQFWYLRGVRPSINANLTRGAVKVAGDIKRRLLPAYLPLLESCVEAGKLYAAQTAWTSDTAGALAKFIGSAPSNVRKARDGHSYEVNVYHSTKLAGRSFDLKVNGDEVSFDHLRVSAETAKQILGLLIAAHKVQ